MNSFFSSVGEKLVNSCVQIPLNSNAFSQHTNFSIWFYDTNVKEISDVIDNLSNKTSCGLDDVCSKVIKACKDVVAPYLSKLVNMSFHQGIFPTALSIAKVFPLFKSGNKACCNNYRPISLLICWGKIFEKIAYSRIYNYLESNNLLHKNQFGFRRKHCTIDAIAEFTEKVRALNDKKTTATVFIDLKKAFDTIDHEILLRKFDLYGLVGPCKNWMKSFLSNRKQCVEVNGVRSKLSDIKYGVPQGSILGPLLFIIYINDLPKACNSSDVFLFADDTNIAGITCSKNELEVDLASVNTWLLNNKLTLNLEKTVHVNFKNVTPDSSYLNIAGSCQVSQSHCKYLGIVLDNQLKYNYHIETVRKKLSVQCGILCKLRHLVPRVFLLRFYDTNVKPIIQYGILVYGCTSLNALKPIHILQKKILRTIYFMKKDEHVGNLFVQNKILSVYELYIYELLKCVLRSAGKLHSEEYMNNLFQYKENPRLTRSAQKNLLKLPSKSNRFKKCSLAYRGAKLFNLLIENGVLETPLEIDNAFFSKIVHSIRDLYILGNIDLTDFVFG